MEERRQLAERRDCAGNAGADQEQASLERAEDIVDTKVLMFCDALKDTG